MSNLLALPQITTDITIPSDQDWIEGLAYVDASGNPVALDGIALSLFVRPALGDPSVIFVASTANGLIQIGPATSTSTVNSVWFTVVYMALDPSSRRRLPAFLIPGSYVYGLQAYDGTVTRTIVSGRLIITQGVP